MCCVVRCASRNYLFTSSSCSGALRPHHTAFVFHPMSRREGGAHPTLARPIVRLPNAHVAPSSVLILRREWRAKNIKVGWWTEEIRTGYSNRVCKGTFGTGNNTYGAPLSSSPFFYLPIPGSHGLQNVLIFLALQLTPTWCQEKSGSWRIGLQASGDATLNWEHLSNLLLWQRSYRTDRFIGPLVNNPLWCQIGLKEAIFLFSIHILSDLHFTYLVGGGGYWGAPKSKLHLQKLGDIWRGGCFFRFTGAFFRVIVKFQWQTGKACRVRHPISTDSVGREHGFRHSLFNMFWASGGIMAW